ncbi:MAG: glutathione S-transferase N-terminal domain-containing protein [Leptolyngbyaceae bacterium]|nr:glutathione S-transferase N-terminal domain-containing protein [Leptolyngbyaceae bacterium]
MMTHPIDLYYWPTPNGKKVSIMLEEVGLAYNVHPINILAGDQFKPEFLQISPNNKIPAMVDPDGPGGDAIALFESGAILLYLAEKTGQLMPKLERDRYTVLQWLMFQIGGIGPMLGQAHHFRKYAPEPIPYAVNRYTNEAGRLYSVLDHRLNEAEYVGGDYSIADIAIYPWLVSYKDQGQSLENFPHVKRWFEGVSDRPAVQRGLAVGKEASANAQIDDAARENMFGSKQYQPRV